MRDMIMMKKKKYLFSYIFTPVAILLVTMAIVNSLFSFRTLRGLIYEEHYNRLETTARVLAASLRNSERPLTEAAGDVCVQLQGSRHIRITFIDMDGVVFADSHEDPAAMENHAMRSEIRRAMTGEEAFSLRKSPTLSVPMLYFAMLLPGQGGSRDSILRISTAAENVQTVLSSAAVSIALSTSLLLAAVMFITVLISRRISKPLGIIAERASEYALFDFSHPIHVEGPAEVISTADSLQKMAGALTGRISEVTRQKQELEAVLTGMNEAVIVLDHNLVITELNPAAARLAGFSSEPVIGKSLILAIRNTGLYDFARKALASRGLLQCSLVLPGESGERDGTHLQVNASTIEGSVLRLVLVMNDITTLKHLEQVRKEFVANVSHELKTPITSIKGFVETLLDGALDDRENARRFLEIIQNQTSRLVDIIDDLLTLSRLEQNGEESGIALERIGLSRVIDDALAICRPRGAEKKIDILMECDKGIEISGNSRLLEQALLNLVDNAVKYCPENSTVSINCSRDPQGRVSLIVKDNGYGIPLHDQSRIFERFYRVEKARSRDAGGTGLGLAIVKHIMLIHGGSVSLTSRPGEGAAFMLNFPSPPS
jgi:two-component system phosphate regulon sensor histidine kinase PhoR